VTNWLFRFIDWSGRTKWMMAWVILTCLLVGGWGFYAYYGPQFQWIGLEHWYVYPFVPDCPLFVYLFAFVMLGRYAKIESPAFTAFVALGNIKYGVWTAFVLFYYFERFFGGAEGGFRSVILLLHFAMVPLGILLWRTTPRLRSSQYVGVLAAFLVFDYFDYFFTRDYQVYPVGLPNHGGPHNTPFSATELGLVPWFTILESIVLVAWLYLAQSQYEPRHADVSEGTRAPVPVDEPLER
jgi:uncharacterized membrane protein YpjA